MGTSSWLATLLDLEMLELAKGIAIASAWTPAGDLPDKTGAEVAEELGGRYLLRYLLPNQVGQFVDGSIAQHFATPTPYAPEETVSYLALPAPTQPRTHVIVLDPGAIPRVLGPQRVRGAQGIQYVLPDGFPKAAIVVPGSSGSAWEIAVR
jgi:hypothetical protein